MAQVPGTVAETLQLRSRMTGSAGAPTSLLAGEAAWNSISKILYIGDGDNGAGVATNIIPLAGSGAFLLASLLGAASGVAPLDTNSKIPLSYIPASLVGGLNYQGTWNAATNSPQLLSGAGTKGYFYKISTGSTSVATTVGTAQGSAGTVVNVSSSTGITVGMLATAAGVPTGDTVASISGSNVTLNTATTTALAAGTAITFATYLDGSGGGTATAPNFQVGDSVHFDGTTWDKIDGPAEAVTTVAGRVGAIVLTSADLTDATAVGRSLLTATSLASQRSLLKLDGVVPVADAAYTIQPTDYTVEYSSITASRVATLPAASGVNAGARVRVGDRSGQVTTSFSIAVTPAGSDKINGAAAAYSIAVPYGQVELISDGNANWTITNVSTPSGIYGGTF